MCGTEEGYPNLPKNQGGSKAVEPENGRCRNRPIFLMRSLLLCLDFIYVCRECPESTSLDQLSTESGTESGTENGIENGTEQIKTKANRPSDMIAVPHYSCPVR